MRVPVLAYHGNNIAGNDYAGNDHVAFASDLRLIDEIGLRIVRLRRVVDVLLGAATDDLADCVALTCDDGTDFDYIDIDHPTAGPQRSLFNCLGDFRAECAHSYHDTNLTSFVIADPVARSEMDRTCMAGRNWMRESWWREANASGLLTIENHSWDHNHGCLPSPGPHNLTRGDFLNVSNAVQAEYEITQAQDYLSERLAERPQLFCYPYGHVPEFLRSEWLPLHGPEVGLRAAFGDGAAPIERSSDRWNLPRYICGWHWKTSDELRAILQR